MIDRCRAADNDPIGWNHLASGYHKQITGTDISKGALDFGAIDHRPDGLWMLAKDIDNALDGAILSAFEHRLAEGKKRYRQGRSKEIAHQRDAGN